MHAKGIPQFYKLANVRSLVSKNMGLPIELYLDDILISSVSKFNDRVDPCFSVENDSPYRSCECMLESITMH
jgi:hypothetical protein